MIQLNRDDGFRGPLLARCLRLLQTGLILVGCLASGAGRVAAQTATPQTLTLLNAIELARKNYPAVKESRARATGAQEGVGLARTAYCRGSMCSGRATERRGTTCSGCSYRRESSLPSPGQSSGPPPTTASGAAQRVHSSRGKRSTSACARRALKLHALRRPSPARRPR